MSEIGHKAEAHSVSGTPAPKEAPPAPPDVSVVIVTWKVRELVDKCLETLYANTHRASLEVIVIDNLSGDGTVEMIEKKYPQAIAVDSGANLGFSGGNNLGFARVLGRTVLLLNPDTEVADGAVDHLLEVLDSSPDIGMTGPKVLLPSGKIQLPCARNFPTLGNQALDILGFAHKWPTHRVFGNYRLGWWDHLDERDVNAISGCCMLVRRDLLNQVGRLDERFFMYGEDLDLCWGVRSSGARIRYVPSAEILHLSEGSSTQDENRMFVETFESMWLFFRKNRGTLQAVLYRLMVGNVSAAWWVLESLRALIVGGEKAKALRKSALPTYAAIIDWVLRGSLRNRGK